MPRYVAFLRAINVGGHTVKMDRLRGLFESLGLARVETYIASGNVIFETASRSAPALERRIEALLLGELGYEVATFLRTDAEVAAVAEHQAFPASKMKAAVAFNVGFLSEPLGREAQAKLLGYTTAMDAFHVHGREVYWLCRMGQSQSTFNNVSMERALRVRATFRGISTIRRLAANLG
ncbi:MAG: DUF1697 domain-containing protein [Candidatus Eisenbacteria bacterium]|nr:DUF1697 domain-containing protein [Candidatus Eisenbacteria bacterium]